MTKLHRKMHSHHCGFQTEMVLIKLGTQSKKTPLREKTRTLKCRINAALEKNDFYLKTFIVYCKSCGGNNKL